MRTGAAIAAAAIGAGLLAGSVTGARSAVAAAPVLSEDFESGAPNWTKTGFWHVQDHPEAISVKSPDINPNLVSLPDSGQLPAAFQGSRVAWFGEPETGTFCGKDFNPSSQTSKNGCLSTQTETGELTSPSFSLVGASSAKLTFEAWWEIEAVDADQYDLMKVEYSTDGGTTWNPVANLNPANNPAGQHDQSYSAEGLETTPQWHQYVADISKAAGASSVKVRFAFDSRDAKYQGFRGWLIDTVAVSTPYDLGAPTISSVSPSCILTSESKTVAVLGSNFPLGTKLLVDGADVNGASPSDQRLEFLAQGLSEGQHNVQAVAPNGAQSNVATLKAAADSCTVVTAPPTPKHTLTVDTTGPGAVAVDGTSCSGHCTTSHPQGAIVKLEAQPTNSNFRGWGGACQGFDPCSLTIDADKSVTASFSVDPIIADIPEPPELPKPVQTLSVNISGGGTVKSSARTTFGSAGIFGGPPAIACGSDQYACYAETDPNATVTLRATPASGQVFKGWQGAQECSGTQTTCNVKVSQARDVTANFGPRKAVPVKVSLNAPKLRIGWKASAGRGNMLVTGNVSKPAKLLLDLRRPRGGPLLRRHFTVSGGSFKHFESLPSRLFPKGARILPGGFVVSITGKTRKFRLPLQLRTTVLPNPNEGVVRQSFASAARQGKAIPRLPSSAREAWANFRFAAQPRSLDLMAAWYRPGGKLLGSIKKSNRPVVSTFLRSNQPLPKGAWRVDLYAGNRLVKRQLVRIG